MPNIIDNLTHLEAALRNDLAAVSEMEEGYRAARRSGVSLPTWDSLTDDILMSWRRVSDTIKSAPGILSEFWPVGLSTYTEESANLQRYDQTIARAVRSINQQEAEAVAISIGHAPGAQPVASVQTAAATGAATKIASIADSAAKFFDITAWSPLRWVVTVAVVVVVIGSIGGVTAIVTKGGRK